MKIFEKFKMLAFVLILGMISISKISSQVINYDSIIDNHKTRKIIKRIEQEKYLMTEFKINRKIIRLTNELSSVASDKELISLTDSKNRILSCVAFWILVKRNNSTIQDIYNKNKEYVKIDSISVRLYEVNKNKIKSDLIFTYTDVNFYSDVFIEKKYLNLIDFK